MQGKTLVTGAPGWLGTQLVKSLIEEGRDVRCLVLPDAPKEELTKMSVEIQEGDVTQAESLKNVAEGVSTVFHCVGLIHPEKIKELYSVNVDGTRNILEESTKTGGVRFVHVSSNSPAGCNLSRDRLMKEDDPPRPYKNYGKSKLQAEELVLDCHREGKVNATIVRPCWFYGPGQPPRQTRFFTMIKAGNPILFGDGNNLRSMSYIDNLIQGLKLAEKNPKADGQIYWIADERPYRTIEIYETVADLLGMKLKPRKIPGFSSTVFEAFDTLIQAVGLYQTEIHVAGEMAKDIACTVEKAKSEIGYQPEIDLREGMKRSIEWCREQGMEI